MSIIYVMIPLALVLVGLAVWALVWAIRSGQFDELESHAWSVVLDDDTQPTPEQTVEHTKEPGNEEEPSSGESRRP